MKLSLCLAVYNEEKNIHYPLDSCINLVDEVVIVDGGSKDKTVEIAKSYGEKVKVFVHKNPKMFHINKQKALDACRGDWILQLDADERLSPELAEEIKKVINMSEKEIEEYQKNLPERELFLRHQAIIEKSKTPNSKSQINSNENSFGSGAWSLKFTAFYIPRLNYFLGKFLRHGGVYPDGAIRLIRRGKARFPCHDVHEVMEVDGRVGWLQTPILHYDSPTFKRYLERNNRYIQLLADELKIKNQKSKIKIANKRSKILHITCYMLHEGVDWMIIKPISWFLATTVRHKGILDGWRGIVFSFFSALRFPRAYLKYISLHLSLLTDVRRLL